MALYIELVSLPSAADWSNINSQEGLQSKLRDQVRVAVCFFLKNWNGGVMDNCNVHNNGQINIQDVIMLFGLMPSMVRTATT